MSFESHWYYGVHIVNDDTQKNQQYVIVRNGGESIEIPTNMDGSLSQSTLEHAFPGAYGLKYKNLETGTSRALLIDSSGANFVAPFDGWTNKIFTVIYKTTTDCCGEEVKITRHELKKMMEENKENQETQQERCTDIVALGLPFELKDEDLKQYFEQFGTVVRCEIKKCRLGKSRGFGFIRMEEYESQVKVLSQSNHLIGRRICTTRLASRKVVAANKRYRIFLRGVSSITKERLEEYFLEQVHRFNKQCQILSCHMVKNSDVAFITFSDSSVTNILVSQHKFQIDGFSILVFFAKPKTTPMPSLSRNYNELFKSKDNYRNNDMDWQSSLNQGCSTFPSQNHNQSNNNTDDGQFDS